MNNPFEHQNYRPRTRHYHGVDEGCCAKRVKPIEIIKGDTTTPFDVNFLKIRITTELPLAGYTGRLSFATYSQDFDSSEVESKLLDVSITSEQTEALAIGIYAGTFELFDAEGERVTLASNIPFAVRMGSIDDIKPDEIDPRTMNVNVSETNNEIEIKLEIHTTVDDVPLDGKEYARKDGAWVEIVPVTIPVTSVNGKTGDVVLEAHDVGAPTISEMNTALGNKADNSALDAHTQDDENPHDTTAAQVGAPTTAEMNTALSGKLGNSGAQTLDGALSIVGTPIAIFSIKNTDATQYSRMLFDGDANDWTSGVGNSSATITDLRNKFYVYDFTHSKIAYTIEPNTLAAKFYGTLEATNLSGENTATNKLQVNGGIRQTSVTTNGFVKYTNSDGTFAVDTTTYVSGTPWRDEGYLTSVPTVTYSKSFVLSNPTSSSDGSIWRVPQAITITAIHVLCMDGTNIVGQLWEYDANGANGSTVGADITGTAGTNVNDDGTLTNPSIASGNYLGWKTTSVSGGVTKVVITYEYTVEA